MIEEYYKAYLKNVFTVFLHKSEENIIANCPILFKSRNMFSRYG